MFLYLRIVCTVYDIHAVGHDEYALRFDSISRGSNTDIMLSDVGEWHATDSGRYAFHVPDDWESEKIERFGKELINTVYAYLSQNRMRTDSASAFATGLKNIGGSTYSKLYKKFLLEGL